MTLSATAASSQNVQALSVPQDQPQALIPSAGLLDAMPTSFVGIITELLSKITTSDIAQVGDLMINGREHAVYADRPPVKKWQA
ncbi:hypothetical protein AKI39_14970 [Bordetella sp. H567]|uniref:hypothetical protein n=1 Tax=Bordetella sp. H567 TaxID=1697043 RepID=UPI00081C5A0A|nr:hypothetical protein [Bordetella sp. H567]AOB31712.1 hypothetical protein AKI39_14970 [Bordetella sp. H567]